MLPEGGKVGLIVGLLSTACAWVIVSRMISSSQLPAKHVYACYLLPSSYTIIHTPGPF